MNRRTRLYRKTQSLQTEKAWNDYRILRNKITNFIRNAHAKYRVRNAKNRYTPINFLTIVMC